uniref:RHS repeat domain-containing protein n=1 Tax=Facilibium subflavum TaxID=2219058 RepID=UPI0013C30A30
CQSRDKKLSLNTKKAKLSTFNAEKGQGQNHSQAKNYKDPLAFSIDNRTGNVSINENIIKLPGKSSSLALALSLQYDQSSAEFQQKNNQKRNLLGLPPGWNYGLSYIDHDQSGKQVLHVNGSTSYQIQSNWKTKDGINTSLRYYDVGNMKFYNGFNDKTPCDNTIKYASKLVYLNGLTQYFSAGGLLLCQQDNFNNTISYTYQLEQGALGEATPYNATLTAVTGSYGQKINITDDGMGSIHIILPDKRQYTLNYNNIALQSITAPDGAISTIKYMTITPTQGTSSSYVLPQKIATETGLVVDLSYGSILACPGSSLNGSCIGQQTIALPVVIKTLSYPEGTNSNNVLETDYNFNVNNGHGGYSSNYTGYPYYSPYGINAANNGLDGLMENSSIANPYQVKVTQDNNQTGKRISALYTYNPLHLLAEKKQYDSQGNIIADTVYRYPANVSGSSIKVLPVSQLPSNYQMPDWVASCKYNPGEDAGRYHLVTTSFNAQGLPTTVKTYDGVENSGNQQSCDPHVTLSPSMLSNLLQTVQTTTYDVPAGAPQEDDGVYGLPVTQETVNYQHDGVTSSHVNTLKLNTLSADGKVIQSSITGAVKDTPALTSLLGRVKQRAQLASMMAEDISNAIDWDTSKGLPKQTNYQYDSAGRNTFSSLSWYQSPTLMMTLDNQLPSGPGSTQSTTNYKQLPATNFNCVSNIQNPVLQITSTDALGHSSIKDICLSNGELLSQTDANGNTTQYRYNAAGQKTAELQPNGVCTATQIFYANNDQVAQTDACINSTVTRPVLPDGLTGNISIQVMHDLSKNSVKSALNGDQNIKVFDGAGHTLAVLDNLGNNGNLRVLEKDQYNDFGQLKSKTKWPDSLNLTSTYAYDDQGRQISITDPQGNTSSKLYDDLNQRYMSCFNGYKQSIVFLNNKGKPKSSFSIPLPTQRSMTFIAQSSDATKGNCSWSDGNASLTSLLATAVSDNDDTLSAQQFYDGLGNPINTIVGDYQSDKALTFGTMSTEMMARLDANSGDYQCKPGQSDCTNAHSKYDFSNKLTQYLVTGNYQSNGQITQQVAQSNWTRDLFGNTATKTLVIQNGNSTSQTSNFALTDEDIAHSDSYVYNKINKLISESTPAPAPENSSLYDPNYKQHTEYWAYDNVGNMITHTSFAGVKFYSQYDNMNRNTQICYYDPQDPSDPSNPYYVTQFKYDTISGQPLAAYKFDVADTKNCTPGAFNPVTRPDDASAISYDYDDAGNTISKTVFDPAVGLVGKTQDQGITLTNGYDHQNRLTCTSDAVAFNHGQSCPAYFEVGKVADPGQYVTTYQYYSAADPQKQGELQAVCRGSDCVIYDYYTKNMDNGAYQAYAGKIMSKAIIHNPASSFDPTKLPSTNSLSSCSVAGDKPCIISDTFYNYDDQKRPLSITTCKDAQCNPSNPTANDVILSISYRYDHLSRIIETVHQSGEYPDNLDLNYDESYAYDALSRLTMDTVYKITPIGAGMSALSVSDGAQIQKTQYSYDSAGNVICKAVNNSFAGMDDTGLKTYRQTFSYNVDNQLINETTQDTSSTLAQTTC